MNKIVWHWYCHWCHHQIGSRLWDFVKVLSWIISGEMQNLLFEVWTHILLPKKFRRFIRQHGELGSDQLKTIKCISQQCYQMVMLKHTSMWSKICLWLEFPIKKKRMCRSCFKKARNSFNKARITNKRDHD